MVFAVWPAKGGNSQPCFPSVGVAACTDNGILAIKCKEKSLENSWSMVNCLGEGDGSFPSLMGPDRA